MSGKGLSKGAKGGKGFGKGRKGEVAVPVGPPRQFRQEDLEGGGLLIDVVGDLFSAECSLCHCVSRCLGMGKGIAVRFKKDFGGLSELRAQDPTIGRTCSLSREGRFIYYLITKEHYSHKPTYDDFTSSLSDMAKHMTQHGITELAMPKIGCGLDKLEWERVRSIIKTIFKGYPGTITVYHLSE